jgi:hypothetical protein
LSDGQFAQVGCDRYVAVHDESAKISRAGIGVDVERLVDFWRHKGIVVDRDAGMTWFNMTSHPTMATAILVQQRANFDWKILYYYGVGSMLNVGGTRT